MSRREFQFSEGSSNKFWAIELDGKKHTVHFGRIGTTGQAQVKEFGSDAEAKKSYEKLIAEKVKKGYVEVGGEAKNAGPATATMARKKKAKEAETSEATPTDKVVAVAPVPGVITEITRTIDLEPADWLWATWRKWKPLKKPEPRPFDLEACLARLTNGDVGYHYQRWKSGEDTQPMSRAEARFWFEAMLEATADIGYDECARRLRKRDFSKPLSLADVKKAMKRPSGGGVDPTCLATITPLLPVAELIELLLDTSLYAEIPHQHNVVEMLLRFHYEELPYLSEKEFASLRGRVAQVFRENPQPTVKSEPLRVHQHLAGVLGCHKELQALLASWTELPPGVQYCPYLLFFGLGDPGLLVSEMKRFGLRLSEWWPSWTRAWLAHTEFSALDVVRDSILNARNKDLARNVFDVLTLVKAPEAAPVMLELSQNSKVQVAARQWLEENVGNAIAGLIPVAAGRGKLADAAIAYLRDARKKGHDKLIEACLKDASADVGEAVRKAVLGFAEKEYAPLKAAPPWLKKALDAAAKATPGKLPPWATPGAMALILIDGKRLDDAQSLAVLHALQRSTFASVDPLINALKENADPAALDAFAWKLFGVWQAEGASSKEKWAMAALGFFGGDESVLKLTPLVRAWPGESQHARAVFGLECLRAIGSDTALMQLNGVATKLKFQGLKNKAREFMEAIATDKGLTPAQLEDRIVPDCDLDARASRVFDFGSRQFHFALGGDMKPMLKDADGKIRPDLPKPSGKDDTGKAEAAVQEWKLLKKQVAEVAKIQAARLEQAMVTGRRWPLKDFETLLVKHPLMINLVRLVVWGGYDSKGKLATTFRVTEDQTYADAKDEATKLKGVDTVGIVHPLHLSAAEKSSWGEVFSDYELVPPFPQLGRPTFALEKSELKGDRIPRFGKVKIPAATLIFGLEKLGWARGLVLDNGFVQGHGKYFPAAKLTAVVHYEEGFTVGYREGWEDQTIVDVHFEKGQAQVGWFYRSRPDKGVPLGKVDPVVLSEVINDLTVLEAKGK